MKITQTSICPSVLLKPADNIQKSYAIRNSTILFQFETLDAFSWMRKKFRKEIKVTSMSLMFLWKKVIKKILGFVFEKGNNRRFGSSLKRKKSEEWLKKFIRRKFSSLNKI